MAGITTQIREPNFAIDLPGDWEQMGDDDSGALVFRDLGSDRTLSVLLLAVRPMFAIADQERLVEDYIGHRSKYEAGQRPRLGEIVSSYGREGDRVVGDWEVVDLETAARIRHHVILNGGLLADFRYEALLDEDVFSAETDAVMSTADATPDPA